MDKQHGPADRLRFSDRAADAVDQACDSVGLDGRNATVIRVGENVLYWLPNVGAVARVARSMAHWDDAVKEVAVARWLAAEHVPAATVLDVKQPVEAAGHPVTFWTFIDGHTGSRDNVTDLGSVLRRLHALPRPSSFKLPSSDLLNRVGSRIASAPISYADRAFLLDRCQTLRLRLAGLSFPLRRTVIHGDAHIGNLMVTDGVVRIIDFERFAWGQPEWDLAMTATEYATAGWWDSAEYGLFVTAYGGFDITHWSGFDILRSVHELKMTTWIMQNVRESDEIADEYVVRLRTLRGGQRTRDWRPF